MPKLLAERILGYIHTNHQARVHDLWLALAPISRAALHRQLLKLVGKEILKKTGKPPLVFYTLSPKGNPTATAIVVSGPIIDLTSCRRTTRHPELTRTSP